MASSKGTWAQLKPGATEEELYEVPASFSFTGYIIVSELNAAATTFTVIVSPDGSATSDEMHQPFEKPIEANESLNTKTFSLQAGGVIRCYSASGEVAFSLTGIKQDA